MPAFNYEIKIKGHLDEQWSEWLGDLAITHDEEGNTLLSGRVVDQAALHGIMAQIRDLGLTLMAIVPENSGAGEQQVTDHAAQPSDMRAGEP